MTSVWVVAESRFEWYEIKHICGNEMAARMLWDKLRLELIADNQKMIRWCEKEGTTSEPWSDNISLLHNMNPGDNPDCDYPDLKEWVLE